MTAPRSAGIPVDCRRSRSARGGRLWLGCFRSLPRGFGRLDSWLFRPTTGARATGMGSLAVAACCRRAHMGRESSAIHIRGTDGNRGYGGPEQVWKHGVAFSKLPEPQEWFFRAGLAYPKRARLEGFQARPVPADQVGECPHAAGRDHLVSTRIVAGRILAMVVGRDRARTRSCIASTCGF